MINNKMKENKSNSEQNQEQKSSKKPDEIGGFYFSSGIKIFDPNSKEVILQKRGDV